MQRLVILIAVVIIFSLLILQGFSPIYKFPAYISAGTEAGTGVSPDTALNEIYFNISTIGIKTATVKSLESDFFVPTKSIQNVWGRYTDGRFGINDVIILLPKPGEYTAARQVLEDIKLARTEYFNNFDVYNAYSIASNGEIVEVGDYMILLMLEDNKKALEMLSSMLK